MPQPHPDQAPSIKHSKSSLTRDCTPSALAAGTERSEGTCAAAACRRGAAIVLVDSSFRAEHFLHRLPCHDACTHPAATSKGTVFTTRRALALRSHADRFSTHAACFKYSRIEFSTQCAGPRNHAQCAMPRERASAAQPPWSTLHTPPGTSSKPSPAPPHPVWLPSM